MLTLLQLIDELTVFDIDVIRTGPDTIRLVNAAGRLSPAAVDAARAHKPKLLALLAERTTSSATGGKKKPTRGKIETLKRSQMPAALKRRALKIAAGTPAALKRALADQGHTDNATAYAALKAGTTALHAWYIRATGGDREGPPPNLPEPDQAELDRLLDAAEQDRVAWEAKAEADRADALHRRQAEPPPPPDDPTWPRALTADFRELWRGEARPPWHRHPATSAQLYRLEKAGLRPPPGITKGEASHAINALIRGEVSAPQPDMRPCEEKEN
jgi:hypothetical protein